MNSLPFLIQDGITSPVKTASFYYLLSKFSTFREYSSVVVRTTLLLKTVIIFEYKNHENDIREIMYLTE